MTYQVVILKRAEQDLTAAEDWIAETSPAAAARWFSSFVDALLSLKKNPQRCGLLRRAKRHLMNFVSSYTDRDKAGPSERFSLSRGVKCEYCEFAGLVRIFSQTRT